MDLFDDHRQRLEQTDAPLAARLRPRTLDEFVGQQHIIGPGRLLRRAIQADQLSSLLFYGPPGTGKTTLAQIIANTTRSHFISVNAVLAGVKDLRAAIATAQAQRGEQGRRTILFVDEVHRFNKAQQDALLPWVENGTLILIGATTENPYFEVNKALVSRSRLFRLLPLEDEDLRRVVDQALSDPERGYGDRPIHIDPEALDHLVSVASGDARTLLNALELAVETTPPSPPEGEPHPPLPPLKGGSAHTPLTSLKDGSTPPRGGQGGVHITLAVAEDSIQQRAVLYDKEGDAHFDTISAFIKSVRGSDPDAALYWLARMVYAGEDPRFLFRRLVILASEDVGLADPSAVGVVTACAEAFDRVGMPEGRYPLAQATLYLATAPKSNSAMGFFDALAAVERERAQVPPHLQDPSRDVDLGHGQQYRYPHAYQDHWVAQQYLPDGLQGQVFYQPSAQGYEGEIAQQVQRRREAQLAAVELEALPEILTLSPTDADADRWLQRSLSQTSAHLAQVRDRLFETLRPQRHHLLLVVNAHNLLLWEAVRQVPEGGVYAAATASERASIEAQMQWASAGPDRTALSPLRQPILLPPFAALGTVLAGKRADAPADGHTDSHTDGPTDSLTAADLEANLEADLQFDGILARNLLLNATDRANTLNALRAIAGDNTTIVLAESLPQESQRISSLVALPPGLQQALLQAEEALYNSDARWGFSDLEQLLNTAPLTPQINTEDLTLALYISPEIIDRWTRRGSGSYCDRLAKVLPSPDIAALSKALRQLTHQTVPWHTRLAFICLQTSKNR